MSKQLVMRKEGDPAFSIASIGYIARSLLLLLCFFPYISFSLTTMDVQPFAFIACVAYLLVSGWKAPKELLFLVLPVVGWLFGAAVTAPGHEFELARSFVIYASPLIISLAVYRILKLGIHMERYLRVAIYAGLIVGILQVIGGAEIISTVVKVRTTEGRGVSGLSAEPSFYGLGCIMLIVLVYVAKFSSLEKRWLVFLLSLQVVALSRSALAIVILLLAGVGYAFVLARRPLISLAVLVSTAILLAQLMLTMEGSRIAQLLNYALQDPSQILLLDASISERVFHIYISIIESVRDLLMPHGFSAFANEISRAKESYPAFWWGDEVNKIMSGVGGAIYEIGIFAIPYLIVLYVIVRKIGFTRKAVFICSVTLMVYFNAFNFAVPYYSLLCGYLAFCYREEQVKRQVELVGSPRMRKEIQIAS